jgi:hypothetical protein
VALYRAQIVGTLCVRELDHGELQTALAELSQQRFRPPRGHSTRRYSTSTLSRWYYAYKQGGLEALRAAGRADKGRGRDLTPAMRELLVAIRQEHPSASVPLILRTLIAEGRLQGPHRRLRRGQRPLRQRHRPFAGRQRPVGWPRGRPARGVVRRKRFLSRRIRALQSDHRHRRHFDAQRYQSFVGDGGYTFAFDDRAGSLSCIAPTTLCTAGYTAVADAANWGAAMGFTLNQVMVAGSATNPFTVPSNAIGIGVLLDNLPPATRVAIDHGGAEYCVTLAAATATPRWSEFNTECWSNQGAFLAGPPDDATFIHFIVPAVAAARDFDFCVITLDFALGTATDAGLE